MATLPLELHEVLEDEYRSMYDREPETVDYAAFEIVDEQEGWARSILCACKVDRGDVSTPDAIKSVLAQFVDGKRAVSALANSPVISDTGRAILSAYAQYAKEEQPRKLNRRIVDEAMCGGIKPLRDMRLAKLYAALHARENADARTALCISGGGVRTATFALGVLQGLSSANIINKFDYLSTVSGGGYIGGWLSSWIRRHPKGVAGVQEDLVRADTGSGGEKKKIPHSTIDPEPQPVRHLREYSNYLSPRRGLTSADGWTIASLYTRNLMLNLLVLVPIIAAALAIPRFFSLLLHWSAAEHFTPATLLNWNIAFLVWAFGYLGFARPVKQGSKGERFRINPDTAHIIGCVVPVVGAATTLALFWAAVASNPASVKNYWKQGVWALLIATVLPWVVYYLFRYIPASAAERRAGLSRQGAAHVTSKILTELVGTLVGVGTSAALLLIIGTKIFPNPTFAIPNVSQIPPFLRGFADALPQAQLYVCFAVPLVLLIFFVQASIFVGLSGYFNEDDDREWWGRAGAFLLLTAAGLAVAATISVLGPVFLYRAPVILSSIGGISGIAAAIFGFSAKTPAKNKQQGQTAPSPMMSMLSAVAVPLFVVIALAGISLGTTWLLQQFNHLGVDDKNVAFSAQFQSQASVSEKIPYGGKTYDVKQEAPKMELASLPVARGTAHLNTIASTKWQEALAIIGAALAAYFLSFFIGVNKFSMHALYRNRMIRGYLGASRYNRDPDRFTGFDENDNLQMYQLRNELVWPNAFGDGKTFAKELLAAVTTASSSEKMAVAEEVWNRLGTVTQWKLKRGAEVDSALRDQLILCVNAVLLDVDLAALAPEAARRAKSKSRMGRNREIFAAFFPIGATQPRGPMHVINGTLNLTTGQKINWQQRKGESFTVSPLHSGSLYVGYRDSRTYGGPEGISLGTAVTISGAAVSPNQGYNSSPPMAFLLTLLNLRLGWWLGNPGVAGRRAYHRAHPWTNVRLLFKELTGQTNDAYAWVNLSDGGHFENLALYEMVLRRSRYIVVSDGGCDPKFTFEDLGNAIRKIRTDLGVPIDIREISMQPRETPAKFTHGRYLAIGTIRYSAIDGNDPKKDGVLVYVKPGLYDEHYFPTDVYNYAQESITFPHETTADQFFSESQFESYRALGRHVINEICGNYPPLDDEIWIPKARTFDTVGQFVHEVRDRLRPTATMVMPSAGAAAPPPWVEEQLKIRETTT